MTSRRDFTAAAAAAGLGAALASVAAAAGSAHAAGPAVPPAPAPGGWIDVQQRGALGDGTTDDTAAIQRVLDETSAGVVYFPPGAYVISRTMRVRTPLAVIGAGARATYLVSRVRGGGAVLDVAGESVDDRLRGLRIADLTVRGDGPDAAGIRLHRVYDSLIQGVRVEGLGSGIECDRAIAVHFDKLTVTGMTAGAGGPGEGVYLYDQSNGCVFTGFRSGDHDGAALRLGDGQNLTLIAPVIESSRATAILVGQERTGRFVTCRGVTIVNPYFEKNAPYDMAFLRSTPAVLIGGYWGPLAKDYVAPIDYHTPITAIGCAFPRAPGGAMRVARANASALFLGCSFDGEVATFTSGAHRATAALRLLDALGDRTVGGGE